MRVWMTLFAMLAVGFAGCVDSDTFDDPADARLAAAALIGEPIEMVHDHNDHSLHTAMHGVNVLSWNTFDITLGLNGFANFDLWNDDDERLALVAIDGDNVGGFLIADISDPTDVTMLGAYTVPGNSFQEVRITPDGRFAVLNIQDLHTDPTTSVSRVANPGRYCPVCIHVVNIEDRTSPFLTSYTPVELLGTHNMDFQEQDGELYLYYVGQPLSYTPGSPASTPGNHVWIARFVASGASAALTPVSTFLHDNSDDGGDRSFPHDVIVQEHPLTGQDIAYVSHWDGGAITFDVTDPMAPVELDAVAAYGPSSALAIHWYWQEEWVRSDGRVIAWSAPEIGALGDGTGVIRSYDVTDPAQVKELGHWELPGEELFIENIFMLSPHTVTVDPELGLAAVAHYHAGVWLIDASNPEKPVHVGVFQPHGNPEYPYTGPVWWKKPNFDPEGYGPNAYMARWDDRGDETILWVTDRGTGLYALEYTGPSFGPLT